MDIFFQGHWRVDWGLGNPNKTAVLIAEIIIASWGFAYWKQRGFWLSTLLSMILGGCLMMTYSRGGFVAMICGVSILLVFAPRPWPKIRILAILAAIVMLGGFAFYSKTVNRYRQGMGEEDLSISNRLAIWKMTPRMMKDAPSGWGFGKSGDAYMQWYQPLDRLERYRTLINSHLTWLVEMGWVGRFLYVLGWGMVFLLCWPSRSNISMIPLAIWGTFAAGSFFSSVAESFWLWILPVIAWVILLISRWRQRTWPPWHAWAIGSCVSCLLLVAILVLGLATPKTVVIRGAPHTVIIESPESAVYKQKQEIQIIRPDKIVLGEHYGHLLRKALKDPMSIDKISVADSLETLSSTQGTLVLTGDLHPHHSKLEKSKWNLFSRIVLLNPRGTPEQEMLSSETEIRIIWGEFRPKDKAPWQTLAETRKNVRLIEAEGAAEYIPEWTDFLKD